MIVRRFRILGAIALALGSFAAGNLSALPASAQTAAPQLRGEHGSKHDIRSVERRLERMIATLQRDQRDYGGHRVNAISLLQQADQQLQAALATDAATSH
ncbi:MAG: hypothetical protein NVSMB19_12270 [Vulcanimicrobiaceae bacterium]